jgi:sugar phosphate isomerase/epimerase
MIYVSSSCIKKQNIKDAIIELNTLGFKNIELSGGTQAYEGLLDDLLELKEKYQLNYLCHNYFPPPEIPFVLNLASLDSDIADLSIQHLKRAIDYSRQLGASRFSFHSGFLINIPLKEIGKAIQKQVLFEEEKAYEAFNARLQDLLDYTNNDLTLYLENNVLSESNFERFEKADPFFFTSQQNLPQIDLKGFKILLDCAHLKVSCNTLGIPFEEEFTALYAQTDYIHISDNNGKSDQNLGLDRNSGIYPFLKSVWKEQKTVTLEVYDGYPSLVKSYELISEINT